MHSTRSGRADFTDAQELAATLSWFVNPNGASAQWVLSEKKRVRVVADALIAWHSAYLNSKAWGIEITQPTIDRPFTDGHYNNAILVGQHYVTLGVAPVWLDYWDGDISASGFVAHEDTVQGRESGKTDPGPKFDRARFIAELEEEDMVLDPKADLKTFKEMLRSVLSNTDVIAVNDAGKSVGSYHPVGLYLYRIRQLQAQVRRLEQGSAEYTDERAVQAVKDKLSN